MSELRTSYTLPKPANNATLAPVGELSTAEQSVVLMMREICQRHERPQIVLEFLGDAWRIHRTSPGKWIKT